MATFLFLGNGNEIETPSNWAGEENDDMDFTKVPEFDDESGLVRMVENPITLPPKPKVFLGKPMGAEDYPVVGTYVSVPSKSKVVWSKEKSMSRAGSASNSTIQTLSVGREDLDPNSLKGGMAGIIPPPRTTRPAPPSIVDLNWNKDRSSRQNAPEDTQIRGRSFSNTRKITSDHGKRGEVLLEGRPISQENRQLSRDRLLSRDKKDGLEPDETPTDWRASRVIEHSDHSFHLIAHPQPSSLLKRDAEEGRNPVELPSLQTSPKKIGISQDSRDPIEFQESNRGERESRVRHMNPVGLSSHPQFNYRSSRSPLGSGNSSKPRLRHSQSPPISAFSISQNRISSQDGVLPSRPSLVDGPRSTVQKSVLILPPPVEKNHLSFEVDPMEREWRVSKPNLTSGVRDPEQLGNRDQRLGAGAGQHLEFESRQDSHRILAELNRGPLEGKTISALTLSRPSHLPPAPSPIERLPSKTETSSWRRSIPALSILSPLNTEVTALEEFPQISMESKFFFSKC